MTRDGRIGSTFYTSSDWKSPPIQKPSRNPRSATTGRDQQLGANFRRRLDMRGQYPCGGIHRREFLGAAAVSMLGTSVVSARQPGGQAAPARQGGALGVPGPYPGRVIEVRNPA